MLQLLDHMTVAMTDARARQQTSSARTETSQLLLIVSDGRLFFEGVQEVKRAVRRTREANIFIAFVILDNPKNKVPYFVLASCC